MSNIMDFEKKFFSVLPPDMNVKRLRVLASASMWHEQPFMAAIHVLSRSGIFDVAYYLSNNPDVVESRMDPLRHFVLHGINENRKFRFNQVDREEVDFPDNHDAASTQAASINFTFEFGEDIPDDLPELMDKKGNLARILFLWREKSDDGVKIALCLRNLQDAPNILRGITARGSAPTRFCFPDRARFLDGVDSFVADRFWPIIHHIDLSAEYFVVDDKGRKASPEEAKRITGILNRQAFVAKHTSAFTSALEIGGLGDYGIAILATAKKNVAHNGEQHRWREFAPGYYQLGKRDFQQLPLPDADSALFDLISGMEPAGAIDEDLICRAAKWLAPDGELWLCFENLLYISGDGQTGISNTALTQIRACLQRYFQLVEIYGHDIDTNENQPRGATCRDRQWLARCRRPLDAHNRPCRVSIIMPLFNKVEYTRRAVAAVYANTPGEEWELLLIDNGSSDATRGISPPDEKTRVYHNSRNEGFANASNQGAFLANGDILVFLNNDTEVQPGWLEPLLEELDDHPRTGVTGARLLYPDGTIQHAGVVIGRDLVPYHIHARRPANYQLAQHRREFPVLTGACLAVRTNEFFEIGMFDEGFRNGHEDIDLCMRYRRGGKKCVYIPQSVVIHHESVSEGRMAMRTKNLERTFFKSRDLLMQDDFNFMAPPASNAKALSFAIKIGVPSRVDKHWGDIYYAECLGKELARAGFSCQIHYLNEWGKEDSDIDVVIHLAGMSVYHPKPWNINVIWMLNHPELHDEEELAKYDAICAASEPYAQILSKKVPIPVYTLLQATDPEHFRPGSETEASETYDLVFVGNNGGVGRKSVRPIIEMLLPKLKDEKLPANLAVWGRGWNGILPSGCLKGEFLPWEKLPEVYSSAKIVLNDHQTSMADNGFVNNRTFDATACGAAVISDKVLGLDDLLEIRQCGNRKELLAAVKDCLANRAAAKMRAIRDRERVIRNFTFAARVKELENIIKQISPKLKSRISQWQSKIHNPDFRRRGPLVSVLMATHNRRQFLRRAIESVREQTYQNWELIITRDGGDFVRDIIDAYADPRIRLIDLEKNQGKGNAINVAFKHSHGAYIAHLDDDDMWHAEHLERLMLPMRSIPRVAFSYADAEQVEIDMSRPQPFQEMSRILRYSVHADIGNLLEYNCINGISFMHTRELFERIGGLDVKLKSLIDFDILRRLANLSPPYHVSYVTSEYYLRKGANNDHITSLFQQNKVKYNLQRLRVLFKNIGLDQKYTKIMSQVRKQALFEYYAARLAKALEEKNGHLCRLCLKLLKVNLTPRNTRRIEELSNMVEKLEGKG